jgi:predicted ester cyclase
MIETAGWTTADWKDFFIKWEDEQYHKGNLGMIDELYSEDLVDHHLPPGYPSGNDGKRQLVRELLAAFPDFRITMDDLIVENTARGDMVVERFTIEGTHHGIYRGIPPTGTRFRTEGIAICRFENGLEVEHWAVIDELGMLEQLGVLQSPFQDGEQA